MKEAARFFPEIGSLDARTTRWRKNMRTQADDSFFPRESNVTKQRHLFSRLTKILLSLPICPFRQFEMRGFAAIPEYVLVPRNEE